ncbi:hypothetical protein OG824_31670 [Streptomyces prunicolor]|uniref:hypothetical protein n=1 Tax=Streptomyces prunicolor TaxID=67348 RepID=UPI0022509B51|nr:hypothetical protein [Streptomyces prunicolor]MCX5239769.1 hypothetical protein [Streptomyces prunicolor]
MTERCDFTDLEPGMCAHCRPALSAPLGAGAPSQRALAPPDAKTEGAERPWFTALYEGLCAACGKPFTAGRQIRLETPAGWRADCCRNTR